MLKIKQQTFLLDSLICNDSYSFIFTCLQSNATITALNLNRCGTVKKHHNYSEDSQVN